MNDLFIVQKCLHGVNKSECVREDERTLCEWYVDPGRVVSESWFVFPCTGARWVGFATQENITGARNLNTIAGRYFKKAIRCNQPYFVMLGPDYHSGELR